MPLSRHIIPENLIEAANAASHGKHHGKNKTTTGSFAYGSRYESDVEIPKFKLPKEGCAADQAYQLIHDETLLDGSETLNTASFVHTWMPPQADKLMVENIGKNFVDGDEYPSTQIIHNRCVSMIADLWHAPKDKKAIGTATTGSSEAIHLGGLAMKKRWQAKMKALGKNIHEPGPNIVMGSEAQVALEKFARYFDVEARLVPISVESNYVLSAKEAIKHVDENTIGVFIILGSTYTGHFENVQEMSDELDKLQERTGIDVPIHVDAASGGFVAPFAYPDYVWDFKIPRVCSINASGHKYGMSYVGVGWIIWGDEALLPKELIFELHYLGSTELSFTLNFSRPAHPIIGQYFNFLNLGFNGYQRIILADLKNARTLSRALEYSEYYTVLSDIHRKVSSSGSLLASAQESIGLEDEDDASLYARGLPVVSFRLTDKFRKEYPDIKQEWIQHLLRQSGWIVPNYALSPNLEKIEILRVVIRESMTGDMMERLVEEIIHVTETLIDQEGPYVAQAKSARVAGEAAKPQDGKKKGPSRRGIGHGSLEKRMGSLNMTNETKHNGTYARQC